MAKALLIIGAILAVIIGGGALFWWWSEATAEQRAEDTGWSACAAAVRDHRGDPSGLRRAGSFEANDTTIMIYFGGATIEGRAVICTADGYKPGGWLPNASLAYADGTAVEPN